MLKLHVAFDPDTCAKSATKSQPTLWASTMSPAKDLDDVFFAVQYNVDDEGQACSTSSVKHIFVDWLWSRLPVRAFIRIDGVTWRFAMIVLYDAIPGRTDLRPPENPAKK